MSRSLSCAGRTRPSGPGSEPGSSGTQTTCPASNRRVGHQPVCFLTRLGASGRPPQPRGATSCGLRLLPTLPAHFPEGAILDEWPTLQLRLQAVRNRASQFNSVWKTRRDFPWRPRPAPGVRNIQSEAQLRCRVDPGPGVTGGGRASGRACSPGAYMSTRLI